MADNGTAASAPTIAWDDIGGVAFQRVKLTFGVDGVATDASASNPLPVSGAFYPATQPVSIASAVPVTDNGGSLTVDGTVAVSGTVPVSGTFWQATQPVSGTITANAGTGTFAISAASLPLPAGASTEATLSALSAKFGALGQTTMAGSAPVVIASNQSAVPVSGTFWQATQPVSGTVTANAGTGTFAISAASLPLPSGAATDAVLTGGTQQSKITDGTNVATVKAASTAAGATDKALVVAVSPNNAVAVTGTFWQATQPVSISGNQAVNNVQIGGVAMATGNGVVGTGVQRVAIASDNTAFSVNAAQSGTWNIGSITTLPALVAGTALIGKVGLDQTTPGTTNAVSLAQIGATTVATGNGVVGTGVQRVAIASDNTAFAVNATLQTGANVIGALTANQTVNNAQVAGVATATGNGVVGTGVQRVAIASDNTAFGVLATGDVANAATDAGNPVKIGGKAAGVTAPTAVTAGQRVNAWFGLNGGQVIQAPSATSAAVSYEFTYIPDMTGQGRPLAGLNFLYNGSTLEPARGMGFNTTTGDTGAKTATGNGATQANPGNKGVQILVVLGTVTGTSPTAVFKVQGSVDGGTTWYDIPGAATASLTATGNFGIMVYPGIAVTVGTTTTGTTATANMVLPRTWRVVWTIGGTTPSFTITNVQYNYIVN